MWLGAYAALMILITSLTNKDRFVEAIPGLTFGIVLAALLMVVMVKFGWMLPILRSKDEIAQIRANKLAARSAARSGSAPAEAEGARARPAPTRRTTTGPSQHPRRTSKSRKR
jgi:hypothetical protein